MNPELIGTAFNLVGILVPLGFSLAITAYHSEKYFRYWTLSYTLAFLSLALEIVTGAIGHPIALTTLEVAFYVGSGWFSLQMAATLAGEHSPGKPAIALTAGGVVAYLLATLAGQPFEVAFLPAILYYIGTQVVLGVKLIRQERVVGQARRWLGGLVIVTGVWVLAYPATVAAGVVWAGFLVSGLLHLLLGIGMVIFLLSDVAVQLQRRNEELVAMERLQADFIRNMSHEFRTPLSALKNATWILSSYETERLSGQQREVVAIMGANVDRFIGLVDTVLDFSKIEAGTMVYDYQGHDLRPIIQNATRALSHLFAQKGLRLEVVVPTAPLETIGDGKMIEQVVTNLLSNALKFTPAGGRVVVRARAEETAAVIEVEDDGVGIAPENLERVFTKFFQVDSSSTRAADGTGLGLSLCRAIVEGHGGRITARRNPDRGVTFAVELPDNLAPSEMPEPMARL